MLYINSRAEELFDVFFPIWIQFNLTVTLVRFT